MKRGLGIIGIIIGVLILIFVLSFIAGTVQSTVSKAPEIQEQVLIKLGLAGTPYYEVNIIEGNRGHIEFTVWDPDPVSGGFVTDFDPITGYKVSEDGIQTSVTSVAAYHKMSVATVLDPSWLSLTCDGCLQALRGTKFKDVNVGFFPSTTGFANKSAAVCSDTGGAYWTAVKNATFALPAGDDKFNSLIIISDGDTTNDYPYFSEDYNTTVEDAVRGLRRGDLQYAIILTSSLPNCVNVPALNTTLNAWGINTIAPPVSTASGSMYISPDGTRRCEEFSGDGSGNFANVALELDGMAPTINLNYKPYAQYDDMTHAIAVKATKKPYSGRAEKGIIYAQI